MYTASITRNYATHEIYIEVHRPDGTTKELCDADRNRGSNDEICRAGARLQEALDGYRGCNGDQVEYIDLISRFAD